MGGRQGGRLRPRRRRRLACGARRRRRPRFASRRSRRRSSCARRFPTRGSSAWDRPSRRDPPARDASVEVASPAGSCPKGVRVHRQARHGNGPLRARRAAGADAGRRRADEPPRDRGHRSRVRARAGRAVRRDRAARTAASSSATSPTAPRRCACRKRGSTPRAAAIAIYGLSPFGDDPAADGLEPVLSWRSHLAQVKLLQPGESTGYGRRFVAERPTWIGLVPVGYADGFRRDLTGTRGARRRRACGRSSARSRWTRSPSSSTARAPGRHAGDADRRRRARRVACGGGWHHQLRDRDRHRIRSKTREPHRWSKHEPRRRRALALLRDRRGGRRARARAGRMAARRAALVPRAASRRRARARLGHGRGHARPRARAARRRGRRHRSRARAARGRAARPLRRTRRSSRATRPRCRSRTSRSTSRARGGRCTTSAGRSSRSPSSRA